MSDILIVDDERDIRELIGDILSDEGHATRLAHDAASCLAEIETAVPSLMVLDIWLKDSDMDGIDILKHVKKSHPEVPIIIISGHGNVEIAVAAIKQGAYDFIEKPFNIDQLMVVVDRAMETSRLRRENITLKAEGGPKLDLIGASNAFKQLISQLDKVAKTNGRVMLSGPSGVGKETAARYIHGQSERAGGNFVSVSSAMVEPERMEEVLFGRDDAEAGPQQGLFEEADGGVIYFDEIADLPLGTQSKILRTLVDQKFSRVGGNEKISVDLRVISSTSRDLEQLIGEGAFREELYHRLNVVPVAVPSLEARREDIAALSNHFITRLNDEQGLPIREVSEKAIAALQTMSWPGNIRQLKNVIERVLILGDDTGPISESELPDTASNPTEEGPSTLSPALAAMSLREAREYFEREYLLAQINRFAGNISRTANFVGMERSALHRKLKSLGVVTSQKEGARVAETEG